MFMFTGTDISRAQPMTGLPLALSLPPLTQTHTYTGRNTEQQTDQSVLQPLKQC